MIFANIVHASAPLYEKDREEMMHRKSVRDNDFYLIRSTADFERGGPFMSTSLARSVSCIMTCLFLAFLGGCGKSEEIIRIGAILPLSGGSAEAGNQHLHGLQLAIEELNGSNPGVAFELVVDNDGGDQGAALAAFKSQLLEKKILVAFTVSRSACLGVVPQAEDEFVPVFANTGHPLITTMHINAFRNFPSAALEARTTANFISASLKIDNIAVLYFNDAAGNDAANAIKNELPQSGIRILELQPYSADAAAITSAVSRVRAQNPGAICVFGSGKATVRVLAALRASHYEGAVIGFFGSSEPAFAAFAKEALEGCYYPVPTAALTRNAVFADRYRKRFNAEPTANSIFAYDAMRIIAKAVDIRRVERISIANALKKIGDFSGSGGNYTYADREWLPEMSIVQMKAGTAVPVD
jgi:branched-chain amino acid transport system substrate-binding protein